jgi:hypothetical protein
MNTHAPRTGMENESRILLGNSVWKEAHEIPRKRYKLCAINPRLTVLKLQVILPYSLYKQLQIEAHQLAERDTEEY